MYEVLGIAVITFLFNVPFGILRSRQKTYSFLWFFYIHLPVPLIFAIRHAVNVSYIYIPLFVASALVGQYLGQKTATRVFKNKTKN